MDHLKYFSSQINNLCIRAQLFKGRIKAIQWITRYQVHKC